MTEPDDTRLNISESADKYRASTDVTRGSGTRDQEKIKLNARDDDPEGAVEGLAEMVEASRELAHELRAIQPDAGVEIHHIAHDAVGVFEAGETEPIVTISVDEYGELEIEGDGSDLVEVPDGDD